MDYGKKENRNRPADDLTLSEFLAIYNDSDRYLVDTLPKEMWDEFFLPNCLLCGGFTTRLQVRKSIPLTCHDFKLAYYSLLWLVGDAYCLRDDWFFLSP